MSCNISLSSPCRNLTSVERQSLRLEEGSTGACLFAVARLQQFGDGVGPQLNMQANENEFVSRVGVDGRFTYVDPRYVYLMEQLDVSCCIQQNYLFLTFQSCWCSWLPSSRSDWSDVLRVLPSR